MATAVRKQQKGANPSTNNRLVLHYLVWMVFKIECNCLSRKSRGAWRGGPPHFINQTHTSRDRGPPISSPGQGFPPINQGNGPPLSLQQSLGPALV